MKYIEIDGERYNVPCCYDCPCFDEYTTHCQHPKNSNGDLERGYMEWEIYEVYVEGCPLKEVE